MLAYVFWHWPAAEAGYETALLAFHHALAAHPPIGFRGSQTARIGSRPWLSVPRAYEDWYFVDDFAALGVLNDAAVSGPRRAPHDLVASRPAGGVAALYGLVRGEVRWPRYAAFRAKPAGIPYEAYLASCVDAGELWQRKMVLGPSPEFCLLSEQPVVDSREIDLLYPDP